MSLTSFQYWLVSRKSMGNNLPLSDVPEYFKNSSNLPWAFKVADNCLFDEMLLSVSDVIIIVGGHIESISWAEGANGKNAGEFGGREGERDLRT